SLIIVGLYQFDQVVASIYAYAYGAFPRIVGSPVPSDRWWVALLNIFLVGLFLALAPFRIKGSWKAHGTYMGFMVSLFAEMYGFPLTVYLLAGATYPSSPLFVGYVWGVGQLVGSPLVIAGILLIYKGWKEIVFKRGTVLVTDGIYAMVRHPQYLGFLLVTLGQFVVWPTIPTALLWPLLAVLYYRQAKREDAALSDASGDRFLAYAKKTPMILPKTPMPRCPNAVPPDRPGPTATPRQHDAPAHEGPIRMVIDDALRALVLSDLHDLFHRVAPRVDHPMGPHLLGQPELALDDVRRGDGGVCHAPEQLEGDVAKSADAEHNDVTSRGRPARRLLDRPDRGEPRIRQRSHVGRFELVQPHEGSIGGPDELCKAAVGGDPGEDQVLAMHVLADAARSA